MSQGGFDWTLLTIIGPALLAVVILWASRADKERTEQATHRLYEQEEAERRGSSEKGP